MTDGDGSEGFGILQLGVEERQRRIRDMESRSRAARLAQLAERKDYVINGRIVSGEQAQAESRAEVEDLPVRQPPSRQTVGDQIVNNPATLRQMLVGNAPPSHIRVHDIKAMGQNQIIRSPQRTLQLFGGSFKAPSAGRHLQGDRISAFASNLLGKPKRRR